MTSSNTFHPITIEVIVENTKIPFFASSNREKPIYKVIEGLPQNKKKLRDSNMIYIAIIAMAATASL